MPNSKTSKIIPKYGRICTDKHRSGIFREFSILVDGKEVNVKLSFSADFTPIITYNDRSFIMRLNDVLRLAVDNGLFLGDEVN